MRFVKTLAIIGTALICFGACLKKKSDEPSRRPAGKSSDGREAEAKTPPAPLPASGIPGPNARELCTRPGSVGDEPQTIEDVIKLINALPKPVTVPCFLDVLKRPLRMNATSNAFSAQPAVSSTEPRIFIFSGKALVISVVPSGAGGEVIEFGFIVDSTHSIKGELKFPANETLAPDAAYTHILLDSKVGTLCTGCHSGERKAGGEYPESAFISRLVKPFSEYDVSLQDLQRSAKICESEKRPECAVLQAIFHGPVQAEAFP